MAEPYRDGRGWCARYRGQGINAFVSGLRTKSEAKDRLRDEIERLKREQDELNGGSSATTLAAALQRFGLTYLATLKGAPQQVRRINRYLSDAGLPWLLLTPRRLPTGGICYDVSLEADFRQRRIPPSLAATRKEVAARTERSSRIRAELACTAVQDITRERIQAFLAAMSRDGLSASTVALERSLLRTFFNHAADFWRWQLKDGNPATRLKLPRINNEVERILSDDEYARIRTELSRSRNREALHIIDLLYETGMRASEPLLYLFEKNIDFDRRVMQLVDAKAGGREVPLSHAAIDALHRLLELNQHRGDGRVMSSSYSALYKAFSRACTAAKVHGVRLHDLRHTAATRVSRAGASEFVLQRFTGHKVPAMLKRYVHHDSADVLNRPGYRGGPLV